MYTLWQRSRDWFVARAESTHSKLLLAALSFTEASVFVIPPDPLLAAIVLVRKDRWLYYALFTTGASIAGAVFGYVVGAALFNFVGIHIVEWYNLAAEMERARVLVNESVFIFTLTTAFTPIPFKVAVLAAGFTHANLASFLIAAIIGRTARYVLVAYAAKLFGEHASVILRRFWWIVTTIAIVGLALYFWYVAVY
jgi:membrane protein YqaA with SNARE-associated domain